MAHTSCLKCGCVLVAGENWSPSASRSYSYACKACVAERGRAHYKANAVRAAELQRERHKRPAEADRAKAYKSKFYAENREKWRGYRESQKAKENSVPWHRAGRMLTWIRARAARDGHEFDLTRDWIEDRLKSGICEVSGIALQLGRDPKYRFMPFGPSVDRIDSSKGYTQDNCRVVVWIYNMAKSEWDDQTVLEFAEALASKRAK